jgi:cystathionine beta-synthase
VWAAVQLAKRVGPGKRIVVILADSVRNYMTKFLDDRWMRESGFTESNWETGTVGELLRSLPRRTVFSVRSSHTLSDAVKLMKQHGISQLPVLDEGRLVGIVTESDLLAKLVDGRAALTSAVAEVMFRKVTTVRQSDDAGALLEIFAKGMVGLVTDERDIVLGVITKMDLVDVLTARPDKRA